MSDCNLEPLDSVSQVSAALQVCGTIIEMESRASCLWLRLFCDNSLAPLSTSRGDGGEKSDESPNLNPCTIESVMEQVEFGGEPP